ncbi:MAG: nitroreductase family protein [Acutalibacteraceae bacterium]|jgi:nitroreductase
MGSFFDLIARRESCRNYLDKKVEQEKIEKCIEAARLAPSACNSQPWSFVAVCSDEVVPKVAKCLQEMGMNKFTDKCPAFIVIIEEKAELAARIGGKIMDQKYAPIDIGLATAQLCLQATEEGLGTCIIGWFNELKLKKLLDITPQKRIRLVIAIGYSADETLREKKRKEIGEIVSYK